MPAKKDLPKLTLILDEIMAALFLPLLPRSITPNQITMVRFLTTPFVLVLFIKEYYLSAFIAFLLVAWTDFLDGSLARTTDRITRWGQFHDPFADKLLVLSFAILVIPKFLGFQILIAIILIELGLFANSIYLSFNKVKTPQAHISGKWKAFLEIVGICALLIYSISFVPWLLLVAKVSLYGALIPGIISLVVYNSI
jgi:CDP-diacylglycerol--glycerol-3-phosphate 3-phosphatidyltransferase